MATTSLPRLTKEDFDARPDGIIRAVIQNCEIFGDDLEFDDPIETELIWKSSMNLDDEPGIDNGCGGWGFAGYDEDHKIYTRYADVGNEHGFRIVNLL